MSIYRVILFIGVCILFLKCDALDSDGSVNPTSFEGRVIFKNIEESVSAEISIAGIKNDIPVNQIVVFENELLQDNGAFTMNFDGDDNIDFFVIDILEKQEEVGPALFNSQDCGNLNCDRINPGGDYDNLEITVELK